MKRGEPISASLQHLVLQPENNRSPRTAIVALHGRGTDAHDLLPLVESLGIGDAIIVAPRAPRRYDFRGGYTWYDLSEQGVPEPHTFRESLDLLRKFLIEIKTGYRIDTAKLILLGFSQGTVMSYATGLLDVANTQAIVALSGYIPLRSGLEYEWDKAANLAVFVSHGTYDKLIPISLAQESVERLKDAGTNLTYKEYAMGHEVREETLQDLRAWIRRELG